LAGCAAFADELEDCDCLEDGRCTLWVFALAVFFFSGAVG
jgi:hypothetical protein